MGSSPITAIAILTVAAGSVPASDVDFATEVAFFDRYSMFFSMLFNICWILYIFSSVT